MNIPSQCLSSCFSVYDDWLDILVEPFPNYTIIACSGTEDFADWLLNLTFIFNKDYVHRGFLSNAYRLIPLILTKINTQKPLILTGHSLGGATSILLAIILKQWGYNVSQVVTFACPKVGTNKFNKIYTELNILTINYVLGKDIIPSLPFHFKPAPGTRVLLPSNTKFGFIRDHFLKGYVKHFNK